MNELNIEKFDPTESQLKELVREEIIIDDPTNESQVKLAHGKRMVLRDARTAIKEKGKELKAGALSFQRAVIKKEKELIEIIAPTENRLKIFEDTAKELKEKEERRALIPERKRQLANVGTDISEEELLTLDSSEFQGVLNQAITENNQRVAAINKEREDALLAKEIELEKKEDEIKIANIKKFESTHDVAPEEIITETPPAQPEPQEEIPTTISEKDDVITAMEKYGGGFVKALAQCYRTADPINFAKLQKAFPEYWKEYTNMV